MDTFAVLPMGGAGAQGRTVHVPRASTTVFQGHGPSILVNI